MVGLGAEEFNPFPHRKHCEWIEQGSGLSVRMCSDGEVMMWHDTITHETWFPTEQPPPKWRRFFRKRRLLHGLGAAAQQGVCPPHPRITAHPSSAIRSLQVALTGLAKRVGDKFVAAGVDGLVGPRTVKALNRAMYMYARNGAPEKFTTGALTRAQVVANAPQLATFVQRSPFPGSAYAPSPPPDATGPAAAPLPAMPEGDTTMPAPGYYSPGYAPQPQYYPPQGYGPPRRGPGGLPTDEASVDVRAFIPAQYEHVRVNPGTVMMVIGAVVIVALVMDRKKKGA